MASQIYEPLRAAIRKEDRDSISAEEILDALGPRAFGLSIMVIMAPVCLPMPPGVPTIAGIILSIFAVQLILGYKSPWLPGWVKRLTINRTKLLNAIDALERRLIFVERIAHPRWRLVTGKIGVRFIGAVFLILGLILILPIPFLGNLPPAIAAGILALALSQRDGILALAGIVAAGAAVAFTWKLTLATVAVVVERFS
jgi:hypothetical protein